MNIITQTPKYIPLVQKPECCAPTCLQMILYRRIGKLFDLQEIALFLGVKINKNHESYFNISLNILNEYNNDEWISTLDSADLINEFFKKEHINLVAQPYKSRSIKKIKSFIIDNINMGNDLWIEYHNNEIHPYDWIDTIHDSLIESVNKTTNEVVLIDPEYEHKPRILTTLRLLKRAISEKFGRETWIIVISEPSL